MCKSKCTFNQVINSESSTDCEEHEDTKSKAFTWSHMQKSLWLKLQLVIGKNSDTGHFVPWRGILNLPPTSPVSGGKPSLNVHFQLFQRLSRAYFRAVKEVRTHPSSLWALFALKDLIGITGCLHRTSENTRILHFDFWLSSYAFPL